MFLVCERCGKGIMRGHNVSHAKNRTNRVWRPNLQAAHAIVNGVNRRIMLCTRCVKVLNKAKKVIKQVEQVAKVAEVAKVEPGEKKTVKTVKKVSKVKK